jgi:hypothetical protein
MKAKPTQPLDDKTKIEALKSVILLLLDQVDYTSGACDVAEMVGAVLPKEAITRARAALQKY